MKMMTRSAIGLPKVTFLDLVSFLIFFAPNVIGALLFRNLIWLFVLIVLSDVLGTVLLIEQIVTLDRSFFLIAMIFLSSTLLSFNAIYLVVEMVVLLIVIDFTFLLRKLSDTSFESSLVKMWFFSIGKPLAASLFLSFALIYIYALVIPSSIVSGAPVLAASSIAAIFIILLVSSSSSLLSSFLKGRK